MASFPVIQRREGEWRSRNFVEVLGVKIPSYFTTDPQLLSDFISDFHPKTDDVFVASYPKSGTTWVQEIVWQIYNGGEVNSNSISKRITFLDTLTSPRFPVQVSEINSLPSPRIFKTHLPYKIVPKGASNNTTCKYIYIARNPRDVAVSYFKFITSSKLIGNGYSGPWEFCAKLFIEGNVGFNHWSDHVLGWWEQKDDPNILFLKYEDMHKDLFSHVRLIANFLNKPLSEDVLCLIAEQCSFSGMKKNASSYAIQSNDDGTLLLRKGVVGDWKNYFTPELHERFEKEVLAKLQGSALEFEFEL